MPPQRRFVEGHVLSNSAGRVLPPTLGVEQIMPRGVLWGKAVPKQKARDKLFAPEGADMDTGMSRGTVGRVLRQKAAGRYSDSGGDDGGRPQGVDGVPVPSERGAVAASSTAALR